MIRWPCFGSSPVVSVSRTSRRTQMATTRCYADLQSNARALFSVLLDRRLNLRDRAFDLVVGQIAMRSAPLGERHRLVDLGGELAHSERIGDRGLRFVGQRFRTPADDDRRQV